jgi:hypothetical protein
MIYPKTSKVVFIHFVLDSLNEKYAYSGQRTVLRSTSWIIIYLKTPELEYVHLSYMYVLDRYE